MRIYLTALLLFLVFSASAQYPVQVTPQLLPPYSLQISDYYSPTAGGGNGKLSLMLLLRDFTRSNLRVKLRMSIESQSLSIRTREDVVLNTFLIEQPGVPLYIAPTDLVQYFNAANLQFSGITREQYEQTGKLPEGFYTFCFEAVEEKTGQTVSQKACTMAWITLSEPPLLNLPRKAEGVIPTTTQYLTFQWTPRHTAAPMAGSIEYVFSLVELDSNAISPEAAFLSRLPLIQATTNLTSLILGASAPIGTTFIYGDSYTPLIQDKKYAWRVQAKAKSGAEDLAMFRNNGYSETYWFTYKNNCAPPIGISATPQGQRLSIEWQDNPVHLEYKVEYRQADTEGAEWFETGNTLPRVSISDLKPATQYEYRVGGACEYGRFTFGSLQRFTTNAEGASTVVQCGLVPDTSGSGTQSLLQTMQPGDTIHAGDFEVVVTNVTGQNSLSGEGFVKVSWLADMKVGVRFSNIGVNTEKQLVSGVIETVYDPTEGGIADVNEFADFFSGFTNLFNNIRDYFKELTNNGEIDPNKIADFKHALNGMQSSFIERIENETLKQATITDFQNLNKALQSIIEGQDCQCTTLNGNSDGGGNYFRGNFKIYNIECCKNIIEENLNNLERTGIRIGSDIADNQIALGNYLPARGYYLSPIHTPLKLPTNSIILKDSRYNSELNKYLLRFETGGKVYEARINNGKFYGYFTANNEEFPLTYNKNDFASSPYKIYSLEQTGDCINAIIKQQLFEFYGNFCDYKVYVDLRNIGALIGDQQPSCGVVSDGTFGNEIEVSKAGPCNEPMKSGEFVLKNGITKRISKARIEEYISGELDDWMRNKETYGEVYIHKLGASSIKHFTRNKNESYNGTAAMDIAKSNFLRGEIEEDYAVWLEYDESKGQVKIYQQFKYGYLIPAKYANGRSANWFGERIKQKIKEKLTNSNLNEPIINKTTQIGDIVEDGKYRTDELLFVEWMIFAGKESGYIVNHAEINPRLWNDIDEKEAHSKSPMSIWSPIAGGGDQALEEVKDLYELVDLAGDCIEDPGVVIDLYNSVTSLTWDDIKGIVKQGYEEKIAQYEKGGTVRQYHITRDGIKAIVLVTTIAKSGPVIIKKGAGLLQNIKKLIKEIPHADVKEKIRNLGNVLAKRFVDDFGGIDNKLLKRLKEDPFVYEDWLNSVKSGFTRIDVKRRLNQFSEYIIESLNGVNLKWKQLPNGLIDFGNRSDLREVLNVTDISSEAHHKIPWGVCKDNRVIQEAAKDGFHPNMPENGVPLTKYKAGDLDESGIHANHPKYDEWIRKQLNDWTFKNGNNFTPHEANDFLQKQLIPSLDQLIESVNKSNKNLNEYFRDLL